MTVTKQNGNVVNQTGNAYISGTTNDSVENSTQNKGVSTTERFINVPLNNWASDRQLEMATWHVSFALIMAPRAHVVSSYVSCLLQKFPLALDSCRKWTTEILAWRLYLKSKNPRIVILDIITLWRSNECYARYRVATYSFFRHVMNVEITRIYATYKVVSPAYHYFHTRPASGLPRHLVNFTY